MRRSMIVGVVALLFVAACGSDDPDSADGGPSSTTTIPDVADAVVPRGEPLLDGLPIVELLSPGESDAGDGPRFAWEAVAGAASYSLSVLGPEGPVWGWRGETTEIWFGGLPFERPPGWAGPALDAGACWSVIARDADGHTLAVSEMVPVSPGATDGHQCVPGEGVVPAA